MKKTFKKSLALLLAAVMLFAAAPIIGLDFSTPASAADENDLAFELINNDTEFEIAACGWTASGDLIIPATYAGVPVTSIGDWAFYDCQSLESVTLPDSITNISERAFQYCKSFVSITLPKNLTSLGEYAFYYCDNLKSVTFAEGSKLESISDSAFEGCSSLENVTLPESMTSLSECAFLDCTDLVSVTIPEGVTSIGKGAFCGCTSLESITFAEGSKLESIGDDSFAICSSLNGIDIPKGVTSIGKNAFEYCTDLESVTIHEGVTSIGSRAFAYCTSLDEIVVDESNANYSSVDGVLFSKDGKTLVCYPAGKADTSYEIPSSVTNIVDNAFINCGNLKSITFAQGSKLERIGNYAFEYCYSLASITIPASVTKIGEDAFSGTAYYKNSDNWTDDTLFIGDCLIEAGEECTSCNIAENTRLIADAAFADAYELDEINAPESNAHFSSEDGVLFSKDKDVLIVYPCAKAGASYVIPNSVAALADYAFYGSDYLESITIPEGVASIGERAFEYSGSLVSVTFAEGIKLKSIGYKQFYGCDSLESIVIPDGVTSIERRAFEDCESLASVTIPEGVTSIGESAFEDCESLASVTIPESMEYIGEDAFEDCDDIYDIYYGGNESDWENVYLGPDNSEILDAQWHYSTVVTGVILDITSKTLIVGATQQLTATVAPEDATNKKVTWESSDTAVATVDENGLVTAISAGTATITVTTRNKGKTATCAITVTNPTVSINDNSGTKEINYGDELLLTATATNLPEGAQIVWYVNGEEKGRGTEFTAPAATSDYTVTVKLVDSDNNILTNAEDNEITDEEDVTVKAGFFQRLVNFLTELFRNLFSILGC